ncbi:MAG: ferric reductase-like transmembrane domain-containing protein, partial [Janthinobacterium lividum]
MAPLAMLFGIVLFSIPQIRRRFYESFYFLHIILGITYLGTLFWHCAQEIDSWAYLWATVAIWLFTIIVRTFWFNRSFNIHTTWLLGSCASFTVLPDGMTRVEVLAPENFTWTPGQHCFLRLPSLSPFDNHPFTIASAPPPPSSNSASPKSLTFLIRSHAGF